MGVSGYRIPSGYPQWAAFAIALLLSACPAVAATIPFTPAGAQLDGDSILDIETAPGAQIAFSISLNTAGLSAPLSQFSFRLTFDNDELMPVTAGYKDALFASGACGSLIAIQFFANAITGGYTNCNIPANTTRAMGTMAFTVLPGLNNDGLSDFGTLVTSATTTAGADVSGQFSGQIVEVQPEATPEPSSLLLLGTGLSLGALFLGREFVFKASKRSS